MMNKKEVFGAIKLFKEFCNNQDACHYCPFGDIGCAENLYPEDYHINFELKEEDKQ